MNGKAVRSILLFVAALFLAVVPSLAHAAEPTSMKVRVGLSSDFVITVDGTLATRGGDPVANARLTISVEDQLVGEARTDDNGNFSVSAGVPEGMRYGQRTLQVRFPGNDNFSPSESAAILAMGESPPSEPEPTEVAIDVSARPTTTYPGALLTISGRVADAGDNPIAGSEVEIALNGRVSQESLAITSEDGTFTTYAEVPADAATGEATVEVSTPGTQDRAAAQTVIKLELHEPPELEDPDENVDGQQPPPDLGEEDGATPDGPAPSSAEAVGASPTPSPSGVEAITSDDYLNPWSILLVAVIVAGGMGVLAVLGIVIRRATGRDREDDDVQFAEDGSSLDERLFGSLEAENALEDEPASSGQETQGPPPRRGA